MEYYQIAIKNLRMRYCNHFDHIESADDVLLVGHKEMLLKVEGFFQCQYIQKKAGYRLDHQN